MDEIKDLVYNQGLIRINDEMNKKVEIKAKGRGALGGYKQGIKKLNTFKPQLQYGDCFAMNPKYPNITIIAEPFKAKYLVVGHPKFISSVLSDRSTAPEKITLKFTYLLEGEINKYETKEISVRYNTQASQF